MLGKKKSKSVIGLDIGAKATKVVQLNFVANNKPQLARCDLIPTGMMDEEFEGTIKTYLKDNKMTGSMVACSLDDPTLKIRKMTLPKMPEADLIEAIRWNFRDSVEGNIDDYAISYSRIDDKKDSDVEQFEIMAYTISKESVISYQTFIQGLGLHPFFIEPQAVTLASTLDRSFGDEDRFIAGVDLGYRHAIFYVVGRGVFLFSRPLIGISLEDKAKVGDSFNQKLAIEIQKSIDTFQVNFKLDQISNLFLSGGGASDELKEYLTTNLGLKTDLLNPFIALSETEGVDSSQMPLFAEAVGLAYLQP